MTANKTPSPLPNLPFVKEGALCKDAKCLRNSYIYANLLSSSNPNRSVLINKSIIQSRKYSSDSAFTEELEEEEEDFPQEIAGSILGSVRSNYVESAGLALSENSRQHERQLSSQLDNRRQTSNFDTKTVSVDREPEKISSGHDSTRNPESDTHPKFGNRSGSTSLMKSAKPSMKLDLSSILKTKRAQPANSSLHLPMTLGSHLNTANTSLFNSLNNSQIKMSPILAETEKPTPISSPQPLKTLPTLDLREAEGLGSVKNTTASFKIPENQTALTVLSHLDQMNLNESDRETVENCINTLTAESYDLKKVISLI